MITDEPLCQDGFLACGDGACIERGLFCNGEKDCNDGSDENSCGKYTNNIPHLTYIDFQIIEQEDSTIKQIPYYMLQMIEINAKPVDSKTKITCSTSMPI